MSHIDRVGGEDLVIDSVNFSYGGKLSIFLNLNLNVKPGEFLSIIGPSGCGKTTLLNLLSGFYQPEQGSVRLRGQPIAPEDTHLGYVFQQPTLFPWLSAIENVEFGLRMIGIPSDARRERALKYFHLVGLKGFEDFLVLRLSGGMQQRVSLARSLAMEPTLLLMDEPFGALDAITRETMNDELLRIWDELGQTVLFITHDIDEAVYLSDRIVVCGRPPHGIYKIMENELPRPRSGPNTRTKDLFWQYKKQLIEDIAVVTAQSPQSEEEMRELRLAQHAEVLE
ncbi:MAG: ABC transporter ATP-binding protein [Gammaproteobacteria bacterium]|nr:ABC transporter ATP-binding protein [Gammaproteobacteria bacterium]